MKTFLAICLQKIEIKNGDRELVLERGKEYIISKPDKKREVIVFSSCWAYGVPVNIFGGLIPGPGN